MKKYLAFFLLIFFVNIKGWGQSTTYTTSGTYTVPAGITSVVVECWGAGGSGGGTSGRRACAGGGSGGGYVKGVVSVTPGSIYSVSVGTAGTTSTGDGGNGGSSWFSNANTILAVGGNGAVGAMVSNIAGAGAATPTSGNIGGNLASFYGGKGADAPSNLVSGGGGGSAGTSSNGIAGNGITGGTAVAGGGAGAYGFTANSDGATGSSPGGGGSGSANPNGNDNKAGGAGGQGQIVITPCITFSLNRTAVVTPICNNTSTVITLTSSATSLPVGTYAVTYNVSAPNAATALTASMNVTTAGTGTFTTAVLANTGISTITITSIGNTTTGCNNGLTTNNTATIVVNAHTAISSRPSPATQTLCQNTAAAALSVNATDANLSYQWYSNTTNNNSGGTPINGAIAATYTPSTGATGTSYYYVLVSGACESVTSETATVTINAATAISTQPSATPQTLCQNATATALSVAATGTGTLTYQWYSNTTSSNTSGTLISGANSASYTPQTTTAGTLYYYVIVSGSCSPTSVPSNVSGAVTVTPLTKINTNPSGRTYCQNTTATALSVSVSGSGTLTYQWYRNTTNSNVGGTPVGVNSSTYTPVTTTAGTLYYYVVVSGSCGTAISGIATVTVNAATAISGPPSPGIQTVCQNTTATSLSVSATGAGTLSYQWYSNATNSNTNGTAISGATSSTYTPATSTAGTFYYYVVVSGSCGIKTSATATVIMNPTTAITAQPSPATQTFCQNTTAPALSVSASGTSLSYQWYSNTANSNNGGTLIPGATASTYIPSTAIAGTSFYYAVVTGGCGTMPSNIAAIVTNPGTTITSQPSTTQTVCQNTSAAALTVAATGIGTLSYQWYSNTANSNIGGTLISGATAASFTPSTAASGTTYYYVIVTGSCGTVTSEPATVIVNTNTSISAQPLPTTQTLCQNTTATNLSVTAIGSNFSYQWYKNTTNSSTGGTIINNAGTSTYTPVTTIAGTAYYYVVVTGSCNMVTSTTATVIVNQKSADPVSATASSATICAGSSTVLTLNGGGGGTNTAIKWYSGSCGGTFVGRGRSLSVSPVTTTTYYCRYEDGAPCNNISSCVSVTITVNPLPAIEPVTGQEYVGTGKDISLQDATTGGIWSIDNNAYATINNSTANPVAVHGVSAGTPVVTYTVTDHSTQCKNNTSTTIHVYNALLAHYYTNQDGNYSDKTIWNIDRIDGNGEVAANEVPTNDDKVTIRHNVILNQNYNGTAIATFEITGRQVNGGAIAGTLTIPPNKYFSSAGAVDFGGNSVTVQSDATGTGAIGAITNNNGVIANATKVTVERYFGGTENPSGKRAWQLVTAPVTGVTINDSWQEGLVSNTNTPVVGNPKYGTIITGRAQRTAANAYSNGYDFWTAIANSSASILRYRPMLVSGTWDTLAGGLKNTNIESYPAYLLFVRGNRSVLNTGFGTTTLRAIGTLKQGKQVTAVPGSSVQAYTLAGNPYASPIDFEQVFKNNGTDGILHQFEIWNSNLGTYGAYQLVNGSGAHYTIVPYPFTNTPTDNDKARYIPGGAGFFVQPADASGGTITIDELAKAPAQTPLINPFRQSNYADKKLYVNLNLKNSDTTATLADGVLARFDNSYSAGIDADDALKQSNLYENLAILSHGTNLIVEERPSIIKLDTLQLKFWNVSKRAYQLQLKADNFDSLTTLQAWLEDSYLKTRQDVSLTGAITTVDFMVTGDSASFRADRFRIIFLNTAIVLPATLKDVKATAQNGGVSIDWKAVNEMNMQRYLVERSTDGSKTFTQINSIAAKNVAAGIIANYNSFDALPKTGDNLYRIKMESKDGTITYSNIVLVAIGKDKKDMQITFYPNPVSEGKLNLQLNNLMPGNYLVNLYSVSGQQVYQKKIIISQPDNTHNEHLFLGNTVAQGSYRLCILNENGTVIKNANIVVIR